MPWLDTFGGFSINHLIAFLAINVFFHLLECAILIGGKENMPSTVDCKVMIYIYNHHHEGQ